MILHGVRLRAHPDDSQLIHRKDLTKVQKRKREMERPKERDGNLSRTLVIAMCDVIIKLLTFGNIGTDPWPYYPL